MYLKFAGCLFCLGAAAMIGFLKAEELKTRVKRLEDLKRMMMYLEGEFRFHRATLSEAFENVSVRMEEPFAGFLKETAEKMAEGKKGSFDEVWEEMSEMLLRTEGFQKEDKQLLELLRSSLGYLDLTMQLETLKLVAAQTENALCKARERLEARGKLYRTMGVTVGALLALLII